MSPKHKQPGWSPLDAGILGLIVALHGFALWRITHLPPPVPEPEPPVLDVVLIKPPDEPPEPPQPIQRIQPKTTQKVTQQVMRDLPQIITDIPVANPIPLPPPAPAPSPTAPAATTPNTTRGGYLIAKSMVKPVYPRKALHDGIEGTVTVLIHVDEKGNPYKVDVVKSSGDFDLDNSARSAALKYVFIPMIVNGVAVKSQGLQDIVFKLNDEG